MPRNLPIHQFCCVGWLKRRNCMWWRQMFCRESASLTFAFSCAFRVLPMFGSNNHEKVAGNSNQKGLSFEAAIFGCSLKGCNEWGAVWAFFSLPFLFYFDFCPSVDMKLAPTWIIHATNAWWAQWMGLSESESFFRIRIRIFFSESESVPNPKA